MQYYLISEVPSAKIMKRLTQLDDERTKRIEAAKAAKLAEGPDNGAAANPKETAALQRRIESLENRVDLLSRQLNEVLKKLDRLQER